MIVNLDEGPSDLEPSNLYGRAYGLSGHITYGLSVSLYKSILLFTQLMHMLCSCTSHGDYLMHMPC